VKIGVISKNSRYKELLEKDEFVKEVYLFSELAGKDSQEELEVESLLIDGECTSYRELEKVRERFPDVPIFYKLHNLKADVVTKTITRLCAAHKITPINEYYTVNQTVQEVLKHLTNSGDYSSDRIVAFFGTHPGVGVSTTVFNVAKVIADRIHGKVLVLSLNAWDAADYFYDYRGKYLNDLKVDLSSESLTATQLHGSLHEHKSFYHLAGNRDVKMQRYFKNNEIQHLLDVAKDEYDLILIDGGVHFDNAVAAQVYIQSNLKFMITSQEEKGYRGYFPYIFHQLLEPMGGKKEDFMLLINRFNPNVSLINEKDLEAEMEMNRIATIPDMGTIGTVSVRQKHLMYDVSDAIYQKPIDVIGNLLISEAGLSEKPRNIETNEKRGVFGLFGKSK
jgi:Flp pilus assembly CpaE family ATPase